MSDKNIDWLKRLQILDKALEENGVRANFCVDAFGKIGYRPDFSKHDKRFEDKIELLNLDLNLQKDKRCEVEIERNYLAERFNQLKDENDELKQRIAELESKETEKPTKINLNETIKVKLTPYGAEIYYKQFDELNKQRGREICKPHMPRIDKDGYTEFQLWHFIELYGEHIGMCKPNVIEPIEIIVCD